MECGIPNKRTYGETGEDGVLWIGEHAEETNTSLEGKRCGKQ